MLWASLRAGWANTALVAVLALVPAVSFVAAWPQYDRARTDRPPSGIVMVPGDAEMAARLSSAETGSTARY